jgi:hypothetical protein
MTAPEEPKFNIVYAQWWAEMRRYRDSEAATASWASTVLLSLIAGVLVFLREPKVSLSLSHKMALGLATGVFTIAACFMMWHAGERYRALRAQAKFLELPWKQELNGMTVRPLHPLLNPLWARTVAVFMLGVLAVFAMTTLK